MSVSQNKKNEQQNNLCTTLTEQWKKGELEWHKSYYCQNRKGEVTKAICLGDSELHSEELGGTINIGYWEVLAPVPSYEEFDNITKCYLCAHEKSDRLEKENQQLKTQIAKLTEIVGVLPSNHSVGNLGYKIKNQRHEINNRLKEINKLKELLKECGRRVRLHKETRSSRSYILYDLEALISEIDNAIGEKK